MTHHYRIFYNSTLSDRPGYGWTAWSEEYVCGCCDRTKNTPVGDGTGFATKDDAKAAAIAAIIALDPEWTAE